MTETGPTPTSSQRSPGATVPRDRGPCRRAPGLDRLALPVVGHGREVGRLVLVLPRASSGADLDADDRAQAVALVDQLGAVLATAAKAG